MANIKIEILSLCLAWLAYVSVHSLLATKIMKNQVEKVFPRVLPYYRFLYNTFATISIALVLYYQFQIDTSFYFIPSLTTKVIGYGACSLGSLIIIAAFFAYPFSEFAGLEVFFKEKKEKPDTLIIKGLSRQIRHPLYLGLFFIGWGIFIALPKLPHLIMAITFVSYIYIGLRIEEKRLLAQFGQEYLNYRNQTPFLFPINIFKKKL